jgi:hypothetical protein
MNQKLKYYKVHRTIVETYQVIARTKKEAIEKVKTGEIIDPSSITVKSESITEIKE